MHGCKRKQCCRPLVAILVVVTITTAAGCARDYLARRRQPRNPLSNTLELFNFAGPKPSDRSEKIIYQYALDSEGQGAVLTKLEQEIKRDPSPEKAYAFAELSYIEGLKAQRTGQDLKALDHFGASVAYAYRYLFDPKCNRIRNPYDPQFRGACDLYNSALEASLRIANKGGSFRPGSTYRIKTKTQEFNVQVVSRGRWHKEDFDRFEFVSDYEINKLTHRHHTYGLGVPLIAVHKNHKNPSPAEKYYPPGLSFPVTAFLRVLPPNPQKNQPHTCVLELIDPLSNSQIAIGNQSVPLETDLTTSLAYVLDQPAFRKRNTATAGLLDPESAAIRQGLFMLEPYDPNRIPVLMVHGLWSSPTTWMQMFNELRSFPEIRDRYQFWFYLYPTGQPFWISATQLRTDLAEVRRTIDPRGQQDNLRRMVLVGHSMGGLVSKLQTIDSGDRFWNIISDKPFNELKADEKTRQELAAVLFFKPDRSVRRLITIGTPHRGSQFSNAYTQWLSRKLITLPSFVVKTGAQLLTKNPKFFRRTELLTISNSIDSLAPTSPILPVMLRSQSPGWIKNHNIIGVVSEARIVGRLTTTGDGIVSASSAHLENVQSELAVDANHVHVHQHPQSVLEVRRILLLHSREMLAEQRTQNPNVYAASYARPQPVSQRAQPRNTHGHESWNQVPYPRGRRVDVRNYASPNRHMHPHGGPAHRTSNGQRERLNHR